MYCSRRLYKGNEYEICLPIKESGVTQVNFYTDEEIKVEKEPVETTGDTMCFDFSVEDLDVLADGVLRYEVVTEYETTDTNAPFVVVTPAAYSAKTLDELLEEAYESGLTACSGSSQTDYFAITNLNSELSGEISLVINGSQSPIFLKTSVDGTNWSEDTEYSTTTTFTIQPGGTLYFDGSSNYGKWSDSWREPVSFRQGENNDPSVFFEVSGDIASLIGGGNHLTIGSEFYGFLSDFTQLKYAENLNLSFKGLSINCYNSMFKGCTSLISVPELPATKLEFYCYSEMFQGCTSLTGVPYNYLHTTTLAIGCYNGMFNGCTSLTAAPELPAMILIGYCYNDMFRGCTSLTQAPALPATTLADNCYQSMFYGCTSLTSAPELPATALTNYCYNYMFYGCTSLTAAPELPTTNIRANHCYDNMFINCTNLNYIKCLAGPDGMTPTYWWVSGVASSGTFVKNPNKSDWTTGPSGIPENWTVIDADI